MILENSAIGNAIPIKMLFQQYASGNGKAIILTMMLVFMMESWDKI